jgi:hypothetical protein
VSAARNPRSFEKEDDFPAFDETLTTGLEDTVRNLRVIRERTHSHEEAQRWQFKAVTDLTEEVKALRREHGNLVRALDKKAGLVNQARFEKLMTEHIDAKVDKIRAIAMWAIGVLFIVIGLLRVIH